MTTIVLNEWTSIEVIECIELVLLKIRDKKKEEKENGTSDNFVRLNWNKWLNTEPIEVYIYAKRILYIY